MPTVETLPPADVLATLATAPDDVTTTILDPWYNKGAGGHRDDYNDWLSEVIAAAARVSRHIFVWGFPEIVAHQVARIPQDFKLVAWLTWYYKNCPSVIRGWRSAQNACLHLSTEDARTYPEHFPERQSVGAMEVGQDAIRSGPAHGSGSAAERRFRRQRRANRTPGPKTTVRY